MTHIIPFKGQSFSSHRQWVSTASRCLTRHSKYNNTQHGDKNGYRGEHFTAMCFDQKLRRVTCGKDFRIAEEEGTFPVFWIWPDQIPELIAELVAAKKETTE